MNKHASCLVCGSKKLRALGAYYTTHALVKCRRCGLVFVETIPSLQELDAYYSSYTYYREEYLSPITIKNFDLLLTEFEKYRKTNKILDVGCGRGQFLQQAKEKGWEVFGTEYSAAAVKICADRGINMCLGKLNSQMFSFSDFDIITSFEVIEHQYTINEEFQSVLALLRKGGLFYCTTPNFNSLLRYYLKTSYNIIRYPEHLTFFSRRSLQYAARTNGFTPVKFQSTGISITRIKTSKKISNEKYIAGDSTDEKLRRRIDSKWYLGMAKKIINAALTLSNLGMTLKGYYINR